MVSLDELLPETSIELDAHPTTRDDAIRAAGALLGADAIAPAYIEAMIERENLVSTFMGDGVAIPHGTFSGKDAVLRDALSVVRIPGGVDWDGNTVTIVIGLAARGSGHIALLSQLATVLLAPGAAESLRTATSARDVRALLADGKQHDDNQQHDTQ